MRNFKVEKLEKGECVVSREPGNSMEPILRSREPVILEPETDWNKFHKGDIVYAKIKGKFYTHLVHGVDAEKGILLGNNHGYVQGWTKKIYASVHMIPRDKQANADEYFKEWLKEREENKNK